MEPETTYDSDLRELALGLGADFFGVADLGPASGFIKEQGGDNVEGYPFALSVGIKMVGDIVDLLPRRDERAVRVSYMHHCYSVINARLDQITSRLTGAIQAAGHSVMPVPASERYDDERIRAIFSNKLAANLAGLGWIGKSCLLVTPGSGPRVRWASVLTDAPLTATGGLSEERCGGCVECVEICPVGAFTGRPFDRDEPREARYDARACQDYLTDLNVGQGAYGVCGLCVYVCPHGRRRART